MQLVTRAIGHHNREVPRSIAIAPVLLWVGLAGASSAMGAQDLAGDQGRELAEQAVRVNPSIKAIEQRIEALDQQVRRATAWRDPEISAEYSNMPIDAWVPGKHPMSGIQFSLKQTFPFPGKVGLREAVAQGRVREERAMLAEGKVELRAMVERAYYQLTLVRHLRAVTARHAELVAQFVEAVRYKYEVGQAGQHDLLRLRVLGRKLRDDLRDFRRDDRALSAEINTALHRGSTVPIVTPRRIEVRPPPDEAKGALEQQVRAHRPVLRRLSQAAETRRLAARQAAREGYPDLTTWVGYRLRTASDNDAGTDFIGFGLSLPLPFWHDRRWGTEGRRNEALARAAEHERSGVFDRIRGALSKALAGWQRAAEQARVYREELMPMAQRALDATFAAYQVGRADFASLFQAELQLLEFQRTTRRAEAATRLLHSEVESLIGRRLAMGAGA